MIQVQKGYHTVYSEKLKLRALDGTSSPEENLVLLGAIRALEWVNAIRGRPVSKYYREMIPDSLRLK